MPQVFVKFVDSGKNPFLVDAGVGDSVRDIVGNAYAQAYPGRALPSNEALEVLLDGKRVANLAHTVGDLNIRKHATLVVELPAKEEPVRRNVTLDKFERFLRVCAGELSNGEVTFISVACFDCNHGTASIVRQQCPTQLLDYCVQNRIDLNIILIDPLFTDTSLKYDQIYNLPGWRLLTEEDEGKVRQYTYTPAVAARACDVWLTIFSASVPEFGMHLTGKGKMIGSVAVSELFASLKNPLMTRSCLISGCFAFEDLDTSQFFTLGAETVIEGTGFPVNP